MFVNSILNPSALDVFAVAMVVIIAITGGAVEAVEAVEAQNEIAWTEMFIPYNNITTIDADEFGNNFPYTSDDPLRQFLHVFQNPSNEPAPVFIFAHSSNNRAESLLPQIDNVAAAGYSVISWESVSSLNPGSKTSLTDFKTCVSDFELVWSWFHANAKFYNFDTESVIIGGRSRGSLCSWSMAHSQNPGIRGIYMFDALPDGAWKKDAEISAGYYVWEELVTIDSPPAFLVFGPECPKPITQDCVVSPEPSNHHNPRHGQTIVDRYTKLGIGKRITLMDGFENKGNRVYDFFRDFVATLSSNSTVDCTDNPTKKFEIEIDGDIKTKDCPWLASKKKSKRKDYCKKKIKVNGNDRKLTKICKETCGLVGYGQCANLQPGRDAPPIVTPKVSGGTPHKDAAEKPKDTSHAKSEVDSNKDEDKIKPEVNTKIVTPKVSGGTPHKDAAEKPKDTSHAKSKDDDKIFNKDEDTIKLEVNTKIVTPKVSSGTPHKDAAEKPKDTSHAKSKGDSNKDEDTIKLEVNTKIVTPKVSGGTPHKDAAEKPKDTSHARRKGDSNEEKDKIKQKGDATELKS